MSFVYFLFFIYAKLWLAAMDLSVGDAETLFRLLDDGDGTLTADELGDGVARLKGAATSMDFTPLAARSRNGAPARLTLCSRALHTDLLN